MVKSEVEDRADFSIIRYAQVWEDADTLLKGLDIQPDDVCLSIASAGDNALAMLAKGPTKVIALDLNPAQLFCLELRVAAYQSLEHPQLLELMGSRACEDRIAHYQQCRNLLSKNAQIFWDDKQQAIALYGAGGIGKFERYFRIFRSRILPLVHSKRVIQELLTDKEQEDKEIFFDNVWNTWRWRLLIRIFFSQTLMGKMGRDPAFFTYVDGSFSDHVSRKIRYGMRSLNPAANPYLNWILKGTHSEALPFSLRAENFENIRNNLDRLEWHLLSTESFAERCLQDGVHIHKHNLSNIFEYMSEKNYTDALSTLINISEPGARLLYWNMMVPRSCPESLHPKLKSHSKLAKSLHANDKAIFYSNLIIEEVR
tara:strand:+ start:496 stop:1605 length:1110 start_codon:yes stop_codon:yes gene_type:complete